MASFSALGAPGATPPPLPPEVAAQMGQSYEHQLAAHQMAHAGAQVGAPGAGGAPNPQGAFLVQGKAVEKVVTDMARMNPKFAAYAERITGILKAGMAASVGGPLAGATSQPSPTAVEGQSSLRPPATEGGAEFIG